MTAPAQPAAGAPEPLPRAEAMADVRTIWRLATRLATSGHLDLEGRAAEVAAMAHYMLYDEDAGIDEDR
ncbi:MAG: hypothetical protein JWM67_797 [Mycobacterium sp.]|nr:hypothetical protein [Mycobacterium sp.]